MKTVLIVLSQNDQSHLNVNESVSALMLFASFDIKVHVLFKDAALSLLQPSEQINEQLKSFLKPVSKMVESFEFYDIEHMYILKQDLNHPIVKTCNYELQSTEFSSAFIKQFDHIIHW